MTKTCGDCLWAMDEAIALSYKIRNTYCKTIHFCDDRPDYIDCPFDDKHLKRKDTPMCQLRRTFEVLRDEVRRLRDCNKGMRALLDIDRAKEIGRRKK